MKKEIKIEDFISKDELDNMTDKEREISKRLFLMNKQELQELTDEFDMMNEINDKLNNILDKLNNK